MKANDFNIEYFKNIREEILKRIEIHYKLVLAKYAMIGALFAYLLNNFNKINISPFLVASIFSFLFDILVLENLGWIRVVGNYISKNIENTKIPIMKWESDCAQIGGLWNCFSPWRYIFGVWIIGLFLWLGYFILDFSVWIAYIDLYFLVTNKVEIFLFVINTYLLAYSFYIIWKTLGRNARLPCTEGTSPIVNK